MQYLYEGEYSVEPTSTFCPLKIDNNLLCTSCMCEDGGFGDRKCPHSCISCKNVCGEHQRKAGSATQLLIHAKMYETADKYCVTGLKDIARDKFSRASDLFWKYPAFAVGANHAFSTTPDDDRGLRGIISNTIWANIEEMIKVPAIEALLMEFNGLAVELLKREIESRRYGVTAVQRDRI